TMHNCISVKLLKIPDHGSARIQSVIYLSPLLYSQWLSEVCRGKVYLKLESEQITGSFKARGSLNKLRWMQEQNIGALPVTASTGNHGLGFARACDLLGLEGKIYLPKTAAESKEEAIRHYDVAISFHGHDPFETETYLRRKADTAGWLDVSPYNDPQIIGGQGTIAIEILDEVSTPDNILATVG